MVCDDESQKRAWMLEIEKALCHRRGPRCRKRRPKPHTCVFFGLAFGDGFKDPHLGKCGLLEASTDGPAASHKVARGCCNNQAFSLTCEAYICFSCCSSRALSSVQTSDIDNRTHSKESVCILQAHNSLHEEIKKRESPFPL